MTICACRVCNERSRQGLPRFAGMSVLADAHVTEDEMPPPPIKAPVVVVEKPAPYPPASWTRGLENALARIVGHIEKRLNRLEYQLSLERRLAALEKCAGGSHLDAADKFERGRPLAEQEYFELCERLRAPLRIGVWSPSHASWRCGR